MSHNWKNILIKPNASLQYALETSDKEGLRLSLVIDDDGRLIGSVSDGDIRRAMLKRLPFDTPVSQIMNCAPKYVVAEETRETILHLMETYELISVPVVDSHKRVIGLETLHQIMKTKRYDNPVFLMAGGFGTRLRPLTDDCPKPLLKVGDKPILETILEGFIDSGFHDFYISTHYMADRIKEYFGDGSRWGVSITYVYEDTPLGTGGALGLLPERAKEQPLIMMNGDILTKVNFEQLLDFHLKSNAKASVCAREYQFQVPYGVIQFQDEYVTSMVEKPTQRHFVNAGIYVLSPEVTRSIQPNHPLDMPSLLSNLMDERECNVNMFPIHEYWLDIGKMNDFEQAQEDYKGFK